MLVTLPCLSSSCHEHYDVVHCNEPPAAATATELTHGPWLARSRLWYSYKVSAPKKRIPVLPRALRRCAARTRDVDLDTLCTASQHEHPRNAPSFCSKLVQRFNCSRLTTGYESTPGIRVSFRTVHVSALQSPPLNYFEAKRLRRALFAIC